MPRRGKVWVAPPNWPPAPAGWEPPPGWRPDPAWGPAPQGWQFWQDRRGTAKPAKPNVDAADSSTPIWDASSMHWGRKQERRAASLMALLAPKLAAGEELLAVFGVSQISPMADMLIFTNARAILGEFRHLGSKAGFVTSVPAGDIWGVDFNWSATVELQFADGSKQRMGLLDRADRVAVESVVAHLVANPPDDALVERTRLADTVEFVPPPAGRPHLGADVTDDFVRDVVRAGVLSEGEELASLFPLVAEASRPNLLVFTNARMLGLRATQGDVSALWSLLPAEAVSFTVTWLNKVIVTVAGDHEVSLGTIDTRDRIALDYYGAVLPERVVPNELADRVAADGLPLPYSARMRGPTTVALRSTESEDQLVRGQVVEGQVLSFTPAMTDAIAAGFPEKDARLIEPILAELAGAEDACAARDVVAEEGRLGQAVRIARTAGLARRGRARDWLGREVEQRAATGRIRKDVEVIGVVGRSLQVFTDRILHDGRCYALDADVAASVEVDGHVLESSRPTLTRMGIGSVLPGSALLVGLALPKTKREDTRTARFIIVHPRWRIEERLDPNSAGSTRGVAAQINAAASSQRRSAVQPPSEARSSSAREFFSPVADELDQLERIAAMEAAGELSPTQAEAMRKRLLGD